MTKRIIKLKEDTRDTQTTLMEAVKQFIRFKTAQGVAELTIRDYKLTFEEFCPISDNSLDITSLKDEVLKYLTSKSDGSPTKYNRPYSVLKCFFNWAITQELIAKNPIDMLGLKKKKDEPRIRAIKAEQIIKLLSVINLKTYIGLRDYSAILLMLDCGIRPKELFSLKTKDVDFDSGLLTVTKYVAKTRKARVLPLSKTVLDLLGRIIKVKPIEWKNDYIFCSYDGEQMNTTMFGKRLHLYGKMIGLRVTPYDLRHSFATLYLENNGNVFALQKTMGHSNLNMTKRYINVSDQKLAEIHSMASPVNTIVKRNTRVIKLFK